MKYSLSIDESRRINAAKLVCTICVLFLHSYANGLQNYCSVRMDVLFYTVTDLLSNVVCDFSVPCFMLMSSVLLFRKKRRWSENIKGKIKSILIPYLIFNTFWILQIAFISLLKKQSIEYAQYGFVEWIDAYMGILPDYKPACTVLWYLRDLFILNILFPAVCLIVDALPIMTLVVAISVWILGVQTPFIHTYAWVFFVLGYYVVKYNVRLTVFGKRSVRFAVIAGTIVLLFLDCATRIDTIHRLYILAMIAFLFMVTERIVRHEHRYRNIIPCLFLIYLAHKSLYQFTSGLIWNGNIYRYFLLYILKPCVGIAGTFLIYSVLKKISPNTLTVIQGGR